MTPPKKPKKLVESRLSYNYCEGVAVSGIPEYSVWKDMRARCYNPKHKSYKYYGGRGIRVCERWVKFLAFFQDMDRRPSPSHTIERINNDGEYEPSNCKWATFAEQSKNKRNTKRISFNGDTFSIGEWARKYNLNRGTLKIRLDLGWSIEEAITTPSRQRNRWSNHEKQN